MPERDPFDLLQDAWQRLDSPPAVRDLADEEEVTQEVVTWMSEAWAQVEVPRAQLETARQPNQPSRGSLPQSRKPLLQIHRFALPATAALLLSALLFWNARQADQEDLAPTEIVAAAPRQASAPSTPDSPDSPAAEIAKPASPQLLANNAEHVQMRVGTVRLTMLRGNEAPLN